MWTDREIEYNVKVYLPTDAVNQSKQIADEMEKALLQYDNLLFNTVCIEHLGELFGGASRNILPCVIDFDELRKSIVDHYNGIVDELRVYYQNSKNPQKIKDDTYGVYQELDKLRENIEWLLRCDHPLPTQLLRVKEAYFYQPKQEKEQSK